MTSADRLRKSKRRSASRRASPPKPPTFFLDENIGRRVAAGLQAAGYTVVSGIDTHQGVEDHIWIPAVADQGYVLITRDQQIRRNPLEVTALLNSSIRAFALTAQAAAPADTLALLLSKMPAICRRCQRSGPFLYTIAAGGTMTEVSLRALKRRARWPLE